MVHIKRLIGIYTDPNRLVVYPNDKHQLVALNFEAEITGGELTIRDEVTAYGYFALAQIYEMDMHGGHVERIEDAFKGLTEAFMK